MQRALEKLDKLEATAQDLVQQLAQLQKSHDALTEENTDLRNQVLKYESALQEAKLKIHTSKVNDHKISALSAEIEQCVQEVDACLELLEQEV